MKLLVDLGNTRFSSAVLEDGMLRYIDALPYDDALNKALEARWADIGVPERVIVSCVATEQNYQRLKNWCQSHWGIATERIVPLSPAFGVELVYAEPHRLGSDRWSAMIAARARADADQAFCIIDSGTALTIDLLNHHGRHLGGYILPGLEMTGRCLNLHTAGVGLSRSAGDNRLSPGESTEQCIHHGALLSQVAVLEYLFYQAGHGKACWILTGGNAELVKDKLSFEVQHRPALVLEGLRVIAEGKV